VSKRLNHHLKDRHGERAITRPSGNKQKPSIGQDLRRSLRQYSRRDADAQINDAVNPERLSRADTCSRVE
jgi:hypothetical protein